jgi:hypothetical protein
MRSQKKYLSFYLLISLLATAPFLFATPNSVDPVVAYDKCQVTAEPTLECAWLRALIRAQVLEALQTIEISRDQRGTEEALEALDVDDAPELQIAACRILGQFPETAGITERVPQLLFSPYVEVQKIAANVLSRNQDPAFGALGNQWEGTHRNVPSSGEFTELPNLPATYAKLGFPQYPNTIRYPIADSDRSVGWATTDSLAVVATNLSKKSGIKPLSYQDWVNRMTQEGVQAVQSMSTDMSALQELSKLSEQYAKTQDPKILEKIDAISKKMNEKGEKQNQASENSVNNIVNFSGMMSQGNIQYFIAEEKTGRVSRLIVIYNEPVFELTVIQMIWDLTDYPKAWS